MIFRGVLLLALLLVARAGSYTNANRLVYLDGADPFYVDGNFPKLLTPQWVGEEGVEAVVTFGIDDMRGSEPYENFMRPILERLKKIDGRAPMSIFSVAPRPEDPQIQKWLKEGVSIEVHTLTHPCPILAKSNFVAAANTYYSCLDLLSSIPGVKPVAFRTPCCDSINSASPRLLAELMCKSDPAGRFLEMDSSVVMLFTTNDASLAKEDVMDAQGRDRFRKYVPFPAFKTTIENYPYPYVINNTLWEMPFVAPSDWESFHIQGNHSPQMLEDWKKALDIIVAKKGLFNFVLHPHGWSSTNQFVEFIDYAEKAYGKRVKFLTYPAVLERFTKNLLGGRPLRTASGDNGVRLLDLNGDGVLDVIAGNITRVWEKDRFLEASFPVTEIAKARFGIIAANKVSVLSTLGAWTFDGGAWRENKDLLKGLESVDFSGARLRDVDNDGACELIVADGRINKVFQWDAAVRKWIALDFSMPVALVNKDGADNGVRFVDVNEDGFDDVIYSNEERYGLHIYYPALHLGFARGWSRQVSAGPRSDPEAIPAFVRGGTNRNNGAWFHSGSLWVQNEDTAHLPDLVERRSFAELLVGNKSAPRSVEDSLKCFVVPDGFKIEAVAVEPMVVDPVAFEWDAAGQLWVVEMRDYPLGVEGGGVVKRLRDVDGDGKYDEAAEFLRGLNFPSGVMPWRGGVLISAAPDLIYAEDTNGDGVADVRKVLVMGFTEGNQQHRFNGFEMGMDGWVYGANGDSGGTLKVLAGVLNEKPFTRGELRLRGDFRFHPDTGEFQIIEGVTQFGRRRDDWDNWFGNNNPTWLWHYYLPSRYVEQNPYLRLTDLRAVTTHDFNLFPAGKTQQRFNDIGKGVTVSAANSPAPYRDELFGSEFATSVFISDPSWNLIHREVLEADGPTFRSGRGLGEKRREFLSSTDTWFRPTMVKTGPDGAMYFADMYRFVLEHPEWIPDDVEAAMDVRAGSDKGRIYRIYPQNASLRKIPNLSGLSGEQLVAALDSPNGWQRDTAQKLMVWRYEKISQKHFDRPITRAQMLWTLENRGELSPRDVAKALNDPDARVRKQALRISESLRDEFPEIGKLAGDVDDTVAFQALLTLGKKRGAFAHAARARAGDGRFRNAMLASCRPHLNELFESFSQIAPRNEAEEHLAVDCARYVSDEATAQKLLGALKSGGAWRFAAAAAMEESPYAKGGSLKLDALREDARRLALDSNAAEGDRLLAARMVRDPEVLLKPDVPVAIQREVVKRLKNPQALVDFWGRAGAVVRQDILSALVQREEFVLALLAGIEERKIPANAFDVSRQQQLRTHRNKKVAERASRLFAELESNRADVVAAYGRAKSLAGDPAKGADIFKTTCSGCHRFHGEGSALGPDLGSVADKPFDYLLASILNPNQAVEARYVAYVALARDGTEFTGVITAETAANVTLQAANNVTQTFSRPDLKELRATGVSLMPEGLESGLDAQAIADLIAYLNFYTKAGQ